MSTFNQIVGFGINSTEAIYYAKLALEYHQIPFERIKCSKKQATHYRVQVKDMKMWVNIVEECNKIYKAGLTPVFPCDCF